jgi:TonB family protein
MEANSKNPIDMLIIVAVVLLAGVAGTWFFVGGDEDEQALAPPPVAPEPVAEQMAQIEEAQDNQALLGLARLAMEAGLLVQPEGSSALDYFSRVLENDPDNEAALDGRERVLDNVALSSETALAAGDAANAMAILATLQQVAPNSIQSVMVEQMLTERQTALTERAGRLIENQRFDEAEAMLDEAATFSVIEPQLLADTRIRLGDARDRVAAEAQKAAALAARQSKTAKQPAAIAKASGKPKAAPGAKKPAVEETKPTDELFVSALARLASGKLVEPRSDSALFYYEEIASLSPDHPDLASLRSDLTDAMLEKASASFSAGNSADSEKWLAYVTGIDPKNPTLASLRAQALERQIETESKRVIPMKQLEIVKFVEPRYPTRAARERISGWADVQFTVSKDGTPTEIEVIEVSDKGYFESATRQAVSKWRFKPRQFQGQVIQQRVGVRVNFSFDS